MGFASIGNLADASADGVGTIYSWRKTPSQATAAGVWFDLSMSPGNPIPNYYASSPAVAATLSSGEGMFHGGNISPLSKHLKTFLALTTTTTPLPMPGILLDYVMYYPFVDMGTTDPQPMTNGISLPRYVSGNGLQIMVIVTNPPSAPTGLSFSCSYTNQSGAAARTATGTFGSGAVSGSVGSSDRTVAGTTGPFLALQTGDTGVRSIESFSMISGTDVGLVSLVLVKPLAQWSIRGIDAPVEIEYLTMTGQLPQIIDGAYLNIVCCPAGSLSGVPMHGMIETVWGSD